MARISVVGTGYVGLITGVTLAHMGHDVICVDIDHKKVDMINSGTPPIYEVGLETMMKDVIDKGRFRATTAIEDATMSSDISYLCVGTPSSADGSIDLSYIEDAARDIGRSISASGKYHVVVTKSTVVPGTGVNVIIPALESFGLVLNRDFGYVSNPEFLKEGTALEDSMNPDRIVLGCSDDRARSVMANVYAGFNCPKLFTTIPSAEMIKYASNAFLATKISYANEMARICNKLGVDVYEVMDGAGLDRRIVRDFLNAGLGFGGSCFPKDVLAIKMKANEAGVDTKLLDAVLEVNRTQPMLAVEYLKEELGELKDKKIVVLGVAFKPDTDDIRESRAIPIVEGLFSVGANVWVWDDLALDNFVEHFKGSEAQFKATRDINEALEGADGAIVQTAWSKVRELTPAQILGLMRKPVVVDGRHVFDATEFREAGVVLRGIGW